MNNYDAHFQEMCKALLPSKGERLFINTYHVHYSIIVILLSVSFGAWKISVRVVCPAFFLLLDSIKLAHSNRWCLFRWRQKFELTPATADMFLFQSLHFTVHSLSTIFESQKWRWKNPLSDSADSVSARSTDGPAASVTDIAAPQHCQFMAN